MNEDYDVRTHALCIIVLMHVYQLEFATLVVVTVSNLHCVIMQRKQTYECLNYKLQSV